MFVNVKRRGFCTLVAFSQFGQSRKMRWTCAATHPTGCVDLNTRRTPHTPLCARHPAHYASSSAHAASHMRVQPCRRAKTHNSPHVVCASLVPAVQPRRCRTTSRDASELSELIYYHDRVGPDASAMAARHWECWAHPVPARRAGEAAAAAAGRLWVGWRSRRGGEPAHARPSGWAGGVRKRARGAEAVGGHAWVTLSDVGFVRVLQRFRVEGMFARPPSQNFGDEGIVLSW